VSIHLRASLVPAAAVIPAQVAYFDVVAVKKLVVGWHPGCAPGEKGVDRSPRRSRSPFCLLLKHALMCLPLPSPSLLEATPFPALLKPTLE